MFITIYGVVCVQLAHFSIGDRKDISIAHVIIIIKSKVSTFPIVIIFFCGCVPQMFATSYSVTYYIYIPGKLGICFHYHCIIVQFMMSAKVRYVLAFRSHSYVCTLHHLIIIIVQTYLKILNLYNTCQIYFVECVNKIKHILCYPLYSMWGCVFSVCQFPL